jgi:hypothetical protein
LKVVDVDDESMVPCDAEEELAQRGEGAATELVRFDLQDVAARGAVFDVGEVAEDGKDPRERVDVRRQERARIGLRQTR